MQNSTFNKMCRHTFTLSPHLFGLAARSIIDVRYKLCLRFNIGVKTSLESGVIIDPIRSVVYRQLWYTNKIYNNIVLL